MYDLIVIGGGIVGIATAWTFQKNNPDARTLLIEKEDRLANHQSGRNSGVIHAGVYYEPGSLKADFCRRGAQATIDFCKTHKLPYEQCGKLIVATDATEAQRLEELIRRCEENGIRSEYWNAAKLLEEEPRVAGVGALFVPDSGITDYTAICRKMAEEFRRLGGTLELGRTVRRIQETPEEVIVETDSQSTGAKQLVVCAGLQADRMVDMMGIPREFSIVPFRGEYYRLPDFKSGVAQRLIYPVPNPEFPFLGVHLTRMIDGSITVGPNAVMGWKREGYGGVNFNLRDVIDLLRFPGSWKLITRYWRAGLPEVWNSLWRRGYLQQVQKYCPSIVEKDLMPYPTGIRAQAVNKDGTLVHDFLFAQSARSLHVCNAPSPAATSSIPIAEHICELLAEKV